MKKNFYTVFLFLSFLLISISNAAGIPFAFKIDDHLPRGITIEKSSSGSTVYHIDDQIVLYQEELVQYWKNSAFVDSTKNITTIDTTAKIIEMTSIIKIGGVFVNSSKVAISYKTFTSNLIIFSGMSSYNWVSGAWKLGAKITYVFDGSGFLTELNTELDPGNGIFIMYSKEIHTNNVLGNPILIITQQYDGSPTLRNYERTTNTYSANDIDVVTGVKAKWINNSAWRDTNRFDWVWNANHKMLSEENSILSGGGTSSLKNYLYEYTYDGNNNNTVKLSKRWDSPSGSYKEYGRLTWTYSATNRNLTSLNETKSGANYVAVSKNTKVYDILDNLLSDLQENFSASIWTNYSKKLYTYTMTDIRESISLSKEFELFNNYPNPFNPSTIIGYTLKFSSDVNLSVYDILGNNIITLVNRVQKAGHYEVSFDAANLAAGAYFYRIMTPENTITKKMLLIK